MAAGKWIGGFIGWMYQDFNEAYQRAYRQRQAQGQRNSFLFSLLVLSSYIIKADGKAMHSEMELVRQMLRQNFGNDAVAQGNEISVRGGRNSSRPCANAADRSISRWTTRSGCNC